MLTGHERLRKQLVKIRGYKGYTICKLCGKRLEIAVQITYEYMVLERRRLETFNPKDISL